MGVVTRTDLDEHRRHRVGHSDRREFTTQIPHSFIAFLGKYERVNGIVNVNTLFLTTLARSPPRQTSSQRRRI